jgi:hypothetical protein
VINCKFQHQSSEGLSDPLLQNTKRDHQELFIPHRVSKTQFLNLHYVLQFLHLKGRKPIVTSHSNWDMQIIEVCFAITLRWQEGKCGAGEMVGKI